MKNGEKMQKKAKKSSEISKSWIGKKKSKIKYAQKKIPPPPSKKVARKSRESLKKKIKE